MVGIVVADIPRAVAFYRLIGLAFPDPKEAEPYVEVRTSNGYRISLNAESMMKSLDPEWTKPQGQRLELAFKCDSPNHVDETYAAVTNAGHRGHKPPWNAVWGQRYAIVVDPDGTHVSLFAPLG
jgi:uncharacterized glyoxalase superfamily protein PhnB